LQTSCTGSLQGYFQKRKTIYANHKRYEPNADISDDIEEEKDRVNFIKSVATLFYSKARIKLNPKKLYTADGYAVQELLKVAQLLYNAYTVKGDEQEECKKRDFWCIF